MRTESRDELVALIASYINDYDADVAWEESPQEAAEYIVDKIVDPFYAALPGRMLMDGKESGNDHA